MSHPNDRKYALTHEWALLDNGLVVTGISDHAQVSLGDLVYVEAPTVGTTVTQGAPVGVVESVKTASDIHAPVSGEVVEINTALEDDPEIVNADPYGKGWIYKIKPSNLDELNALIDAQQYVASTQ